MRLFRKSITKVRLSDVASPKPTRAASKALDRAMQRAYGEQQATIKRARAIRAN